MAAKLCLEVGGQIIIVDKADSFRVGDALVDPGQEAIMMLSPVRCVRGHGNGSRLPILRGDKGSGVARLPAHRGYRRRGRA